jgi:5-methylcytosine-specific restriction protein B
VLSGNRTGFEQHRGPFLTVCEDALEEQDRLFVLIIDEINRGDPARIFGELLYALEYRGREVIMANGTPLTVPPNLVVLGTMNSVDRSVAMVDYALRRRFRFLRVDPDPSLVADKWPTALGRAASEGLAAVNRRICEVADQDRQLGHSYFLTPGVRLATHAELEAIWRTDLLPQVGELFFGQVDVIRELQKLWRASVEAALAEADIVKSAEDAATGG